MWFDVKIFSFAYFVIESWKTPPGYFLAILGDLVEGGRWKSPNSRLFLGIFELLGVVEQGLRVRSSKNY